MALGRSTLNPNAPLFIPAAVRQVEDFSPEWWQLATTSRWFHDYWLNQQQGDDDDSEDIASKLPDTIDVEDDDELLNMEAQFDQFIQSCEAEAKHEYHLYAHNRMSEIEFSESLGLSNSNNKRVPKSLVQGSTTMFWGKPSKPFISPKSSYSRIQQPR